MKVSKETITQVNAILQNIDAEEEVKNSKYVVYARNNEEEMKEYVKLVDEKELEFYLTGALMCSELTYLQSIYIMNELMGKYNELCREKVV